MREELSLPVTMEFIAAVVTAAFGQDDEARLVAALDAYLAGINAAQQELCPAGPVGPFVTAGAIFNRATLEVRDASGTREVDGDRSTHVVGSVAFEGRRDDLEGTLGEDGAAVASVYSTDAVIIDGRGARVSGADAIRQYMDARASEGGHMVLASDSVRVYGNTAVDIGTVTIHPEGGGEEVADYMAVSRRGMT